MNYVAGIMFVFLLINVLRVHEEFKKLSWSSGTLDVIYFCALIFFTILFFGWMLEAVKDYYNLSKE